MCRRSSWLAGALAAGSCACATPRDPVRIDTGGVLAFDVRATLPFGDQSARHALAEGSPEDAVGRLTGLEFEYTFVQDDGAQSLGSGDSLLLDRQSFAGPGDVDYDYTINTFALAADAAQVFEGGFAVGAIFGVASHTADLRGRFQGARDSVNVFSAGPVAGVELAWYAPSPFHVFGRYLASYELADERDTVSTSSIELGGAWSFGTYFSLGAGWRWWSYDAEEIGAPTSDLRLDLNGPLVTLGFAP